MVAISKAGFLASSGIEITLCKLFQLVFISSVKTIINAVLWSEPLRVDKKLSNANLGREVHEEDKTALRPRL